MFVGNVQAYNLVQQFLRKKQFPHLLISGPSGHGKNTLTYEIANKSNRHLLEINANTIDDSNNVFAILKTAKHNSIIFLDEAHGLPRKLQDSLYPILDGHQFYNRITGRGKQQTVVQERIPTSLTFIFATTREDKINEALKRRTVAIQIHPYSNQELYQIAKLQFNDEFILHKLVEYSRGTPGRLKNLMKLIADEAHPKESLISLIKNMGLFPLGLTRTEIMLMKSLPSSLKNMSLKLNLAEEVIEQEHEPYLRRLNFIETTQHGRVLTERGQKYLVLTNNAPVILPSSAPPTQIPQTPTQ